MLRNKPAAFYVRARNGGHKILVTADIAHEYRDAIKFIRLDEPAPQDGNDEPMPILTKRTHKVVEESKLTPSQKAAQTVAKSKAKKLKG